MSAITPKADIGGRTWFHSVTQARRILRLSGPFLRQAVCLREQPKAGWIPSPRRGLHADRGGSRADLDLLSLHANRKFTGVTRANDLSSRC